MHILYILDFYKPNNGGIEILFDNIINRVSKNHTVSIITFRYSDKLPKYEQINEKINIYRVGKWNLINFIFSAYKKWKEIIDDIDIIHTSNFYAVFPSKFLSYKYKKKALVHINGFFGKYRNNFIWWKGYKFRILEWITCKLKFDKYICVSRYIKWVLKTLYGVKEDKLEVIYNGVDYDLWNVDNFPEENIQFIIDKYRLDYFYSVLFYGRPDRIKGIDFFIQAIPKILEKIPNFKAFLIVPDNEKENRDYKFLQKRIQELWVEENIIQIGAIEHELLWNYILAVDCVIMPSLWEAFGYAAAETSALGQNLIVSSIAALPEVSSGRVNFIEPSNSDAIVDAIWNFYNGKYTEIPFRWFYWEDNIKKIEKLYKLKN